MRVHHRLLVLGAPLVLAASHAIGADNLADPLEVSIEVTANPSQNSQGMRCKTSAQVEGPRQGWWVTFGGAELHPEEGWQAVDGGIVCGAGSFENRSSDAGPETAVPYLIATVSTSAGLRPPGLTPERVLVLGISLSLQKLSSLGTEGKPVYQEAEERRQFYFLESGKAFLPLLVADEVEEEAFGIREVFLEVAARRVRGDTVAAYGVVRATSRAYQGELLLDGGVVGETAAGTETELLNVPAGLWLVGLRDTSGRELRRAVRVEAGRAVLVAFPAADPPGEPVLYRLEALGKNDQGYEEYRRGSDGAVTVKIPAGEFLMGNKETEGSPLEHKVHVSDFLIDKTSVTWGRYKQYAESTGIPLPPRDPYWGIHNDHPVVFVSWEEAKAYCEWAGGRLPTEAEREKASRGTDHRKYPWGNDEPAPHLGVFRSSWGFGTTAPVGTHPAGVSPYGVLDMGGNVWEWCSDWWDRDYFEVSPYRDPKGPPSGAAHVLKGGSWDSRPSVLSSSSRNFGARGYREFDFGFRCAMNAP
jgi:formylglycine-generating enzyme required for sulfatase activity